MPIALIRPAVPRPNPPKLYQYLGREMTLTDISKETGLDRRSLYNRIYFKKMSVEDAVANLTTPTAPVLVSHAPQLDAGPDAPLELEVHTAPYSESNKVHQTREEHPALPAGAGVPRVPWWIRRKIKSSTICGINGCPTYDEQLRANRIRSGTEHAYNQLFVREIIRQQRIAQAGEKYIKLIREGTYSYAVGLRSNIVLTGG